jgi:hypothetical protein
VPAQCLLHGTRLQAERWCDPGPRWALAPDLLRSRERAGSADHYFTARGSDEASPDDGARVHVLDVAAGTWDLLPPDPLGPSFDRVLAWTDAGLVVLAKKLVPSPGSADGPAFVRAAIFANGAWVRFPDLDCIGGWTWHWTGTRLICPQLGGADGSEINGYARVIPFGGRLDPVTGEFAALPNPPVPQVPPSLLEAAGSGTRLVSQGQLYDDSTGSWTALDLPPGGKWIEIAGVVLDDRIVVVGGYDEADGYRSAAGLTSAAWRLAIPRS